ncbi:MAG: hypothetical protein KAJ14_10050, partial [Candidatus Omnitrophica bacterium]|nr:hypothetical protein [Candidatus Omnitrophota bacterium]
LNALSVPVEIYEKIKSVFIKRENLIKGISDLRNNINEDSFVELLAYYLEELEEIRKDNGWIESKKEEIEKDYASLGNMIDQEYFVPSELSDSVLKGIYTQLHKLTFINNIKKLGIKEIFKHKAYAVLSLGMLLVVWKVSHLTLLEPLVNLFIGLGVNAELASGLAFKFLIIPQGYLLIVPAIILVVGAYRTIKINSLTIEQLLEDINNLSNNNREEDIEMLNSSKRTKKELIAVYVELLKVSRKKWDLEKGLINKDENSVLQKIRKTRINLFVELAESVNKSWNLVGKSKKYGPVLALPVLFIMGPINFLLTVAFLFFTSYAINNIRFLQALKRGEIKLENPEHLQNAIRKVNKGNYGFIERSNNGLFSLSLSSPIFAGMLRFTLSRVSLALIAWNFSGPVAPVLANFMGLDGLVPGLPVLYDLIGGFFALIPWIGINGVGDFLMMNIQPTWENFIRVFLLALVLSAVPTIR